MEVPVGLGRVYPRSPAKAFRGALHNLIQSVREAFQSPGPMREEAGPSHQASVFPMASSSSLGSCFQEPSAHQQDPASPSYLPLEEQLQVSKTLQPPDKRKVPAASPSAPSSLALLGSHSFHGCPGDLRYMLGESSLLQAAGGGEEAPSDKTDYLGESAKELGKAVSASMGLAVEALDKPGGGEMAATRGDCLFAGARARPPTLGGCKIVEAEEGGGALAMEVPGYLSLYKDSPELEEPSRAFPNRDYYNFQLALASRGGIKRESPLESAPGGAVWGPQCRRAWDVPAALAPHYAGPPGPSWHPFFTAEGQLYEGAPPASCGYSRSQEPPSGQEGAELPPSNPGGVVGRMPLAPAAGCIKTELTPWMEGYPGAYGDMRIESGRDHIIPVLRDLHWLPRPCSSLCTASASGCHYGAITCGSCKVFFKRAAEGKQKYLCASRNDCNIDKFRRKNCPSCRLRRCHEAGMTLRARKLKKLGNLKMQTEGEAAGPSRPKEEQAPKMTMTRTESLERQPIFLHVLEAIEPGVVCVGRDNNQPDPFAVLLNESGERQLVHVLKWSKALPGFAPSHP
ncbi:androgen receptor-like [Lacerta agilis]|uniref:androgen receptor-like n=1 Tax=Lacerta agilis TaxID=80427 RepID=UPI001419475E|nr:androgen receptor-like [Lacerta agilis]